MHRFAAECEMIAVADSGRLTDDVAESLGSVVRRFHAGCPVRHERGDVLIRDILDELGRVLAPFAPESGAGWSKPSWTARGSFGPASPRPCATARQWATSSGCTVTCICAIFC